MFTPHLTRYIDLFSSGFVPTAEHPHAALGIRDERIQNAPAQSEKPALVDELPESSSDLTQKLPPEILGHIFICCLPELSAAPNSAARDLAPQLLVQVCKRWQAVAAGTPQLWTTLGLHGLCHIDPIALISTFLRRSGALPLDIYIDPLTWSYAPRRALPQAAQLLARALHRCRTLHTSSHPALLENLLPAGSRVDAPRLRDLRIAAAPKSSGHAPRGRLHAPALAALDVCDPHAALRALGGDGGAVRHVRWDAAHAPAHASLAHLAALLRACPRLETCAVVRPAGPLADADADAAAIRLPHLRRLSLRWPAALDIAPLLRLLDAPALAHLRLEAEPAAVPLPGAGAGAGPSLAHALHALFPDAAATPLRELHAVGLCLSPELPRIARMYFEDCTGEGQGAAVLQEVVKAPEAQLDH